MTIVTPAPEIPRDRYNRPLVVPPAGGKPVPYTRCTTFIDAIEDKFGLMKWMMRMTALGLAERPDLQLAVSAHRDDKKQLDRICEDAKEHAGASNAATTGTALHAFTEAVDRGQDLPILPDSVIADVDAYKAATADLKAVHIEAFTVLDTLQIGGTPDRVVDYQGKRYIADLKTGSIEYGALKIAAQLAVYSRSWLYDHQTGERSHHGADTSRGIIIHLPAGTGQATLHWVDLRAGWEAVKVARDVREQRRLKFKDLVEPLTPDAQPFATPPPNSVEAQIRACLTPDGVRALWSPDWDDDLVEVAREHVTRLEAAAAAHQTPDVA